MNATQTDPTDQTVCPHGEKLYGGQVPHSECKQCAYPSGLARARDDERERILNALSAFIKQRAGFDYRNYVSDYRDVAGRAAYFAEVRSVTRDLHDARELLGNVRWRESITAEHLKEAFRAFSGRLSWRAKGATCETCKGTGKLDYAAGIAGRACYTCKGSGTYATDSLKYVTGQYFPTEYRKAVCAVLSQALWDNWRDAATTGDDIRAIARRELSRGVARRWFN